MKPAVIAAVTTALAALLVVFALCAWPAPGTDAPSFLVSAINYASGRGLVNPFYPQLAFSDPTGLQRHLHYPPLFPLVVAALMPWPTPQGAFLAVALLRGASLALAAAALWREVSRPAPPGWPEAMLVCASLLGLCTSWLPTLGRPEALGTLFVLLALTAVQRWRGPALVVALAVLVGLTAATQPAGAVESALVVGLGAALTRPARVALPALAAIGLGAAAVFTLVLAVSPHGLMETLAGMARAFPQTPWTAPPGWDWWKPWLLFRRATFYGPLMLAAAAAGAGLVFARRRRPAAPALFTACALGLLLVLYYGSLTHRSLRNYNALMLAPLAYVVLAAWFAAARARPFRWTRAARGAVFACVAATATGIIGYAAALPWYLRDGRRLDTARREWTSLALPPGPRLLFLGGPLWSLTEDYGRIDIDPRVLALPRPAPLLVTGQRRADPGSPPPVPRFRLLADAYNPKLAGLRAPLRWFVEEDYSFAVYAPE